jgi:hypothetical protein
MSADNYYLVLPHPEGGFGVAMGFASDNTMPELLSTDERYPTIDHALHAYDQEYSEYGISVDKSCYGDVSTIDPNEIFGAANDVHDQLADEIAFVLMNRDGAKYTIAEAYETSDDIAKAVRKYIADRV